MSFFQRLKNLAELSKTEPKQPLESEKVYATQPKEKKLAQVIFLDDPLSVFDKEDDNSDK